MSKTKLLQAVRATRIEWEGMLEIIEKWDSLPALPIEPSPSELCRMTMKDLQVRCDECPMALIGEQCDSDAYNKPSALEKFKWSSTVEEAIENACTVVSVLRGIEEELKEANVFHHTTKPHNIIQPIEGPSGY